MGEEPPNTAERETGGLTITFEASPALLLADDGSGTQTTFVDNQMGGTTLELSWDSGSGGPWRFSAALDLDFFHLKSDEVSQSRRSGGLSAEVGGASLSVERTGLVSLTAGLTGGASDGVGEIDLSGTQIAGSINLDDAGGGYVLRGAQGGLTDIAWSDAFDSLDNFGGPNGLALRIESAPLSGVTLSSALGERDAWDAAIRFESAGAIAFAAGAGFHRRPHGDEDDRAGDTLLGSLSLLHRASGLNFTLAGGRGSFARGAGADDEASERPAPRTFTYAKLGYRRALFAARETALFAEFGRFNDGIGVDVEGADIAALADIPADARCEAPGVACTISGAEGDVWGAGVVQDMTTHLRVFAAYRSYGLALNFADLNRAPLGAASSHSFVTTMIGLHILF